MNLTWDKENERDNHPLLPRAIRAIVVGSSGCGKTCWMLNALVNPKDYPLDYNRMYVFGNALQQMEYRIIKAALDQNLTKKDICDLFKKKQFLRENRLDVFQVIKSIADASQQQRTSQPIETFFFDDSTAVPKPCELDKSKKNVMVFDDLMMESNQKTCESYYCLGRHSNCDMFYLTQNFIELPRHSIRGNCNFLVVFKQNDHDCKGIWTDMASKDISFKDFFKICKKAWSKKFGYIVIDKESEPCRIRVGIRDLQG